MKQSENKKQHKNYTCEICESSILFSFTKDTFDVYTCPNCGFMQVRPTPPHEVFEKLYSSSYFQNVEGGHGYTEYDRDKEPMRTVFELYLKKLEQLVSGRNIFDVGAATGYFLDIAKKRGWNTAGSEISAYAREECVRREHTMYDVGEAVDNARVDSMDVVTLWDVLEHVTSPRETLQETRALLMRGGVVAINTVDRSSVWARLFGKRWHLIVPPEHLNYFSTKSIQLLLSQEGFEVIEMRKIGKYFSLPYIFNTLARWQGLRLWYVLARLTDTTFLRKVAIPINLRDNVFVLARKV